MKRLRSSIILRLTACLTSLLTAAASLAAAESSTANFVGTLGGKAVVAHLEIGQGSGQILGGSYFYRQIGRDIELIRNKDGRLGECPADEHYDDEGCEKSSGYWKVGMGANGVSGSWHSVDGRKSLPIALAPSKAGTAADDSDAEFLRLRLEGGKQTVVASRSANGVRWQVRKDIRSGITMPILTAGVAEPALSQVNGALKESFDQDINEALTAAEYSPNNEVLFANPRFFVVGGGVSAYYMGAAHPLYGFTVTVFDLASGKAVDMKNYFRISDPKAAKIDLRRNDLLDAVALRAFLREAQKETDGEMPCASTVTTLFGCEKSSCDQNQGFDSALIYPTDKGLAVTIDAYSEVDRGCRGEGVVLPWSAVRKAQLQVITLP